MPDRAIPQVHEQLQLLRGNIRVLARVRPCAGGEAAAVECPLPGEVVVHPGADKRPQAFEFSAVFGPESSQASLTRRSVEHLHGMSAYAECA